MNSFAIAEALADSLVARKARFKALRFKNFAETVFLLIAVLTTQHPARFPIVLICTGIIIYLNTFYIRPFEIADQDAQARLTLQVAAACKAEGYRVSNDG